MEIDDLTPDERNAFKSLSNERTPPDLLESEIIGQLTARKLIKAKGKKWKRIVYPVAATFIFLLGFLVGDVERGINKEEAYMLILFEDENFHVRNSTDAAIEYGLWNAKINHSGILMDGQELWNEGYRISTNGVEKLSSAHESRITGYFVLEATTEEEAIAVARESPHVKYGGSIQVKRFRVR